jgi:GrpB-like predicted nucleotidyltransferase (UPF0157 family)
MLPVAPIEVVPYNPAWPEQFQQLRAHLAGTLADLALAIEHIGSTSVPGLAAKPILDIVIVIPAGAPLRFVVDSLARLGYRHQGDLGLAGREAFERPGSDVPLDSSGRIWPPQHLYVCHEGNLHLVRQIAFRDFLRTNPSDACAYGDLKLRLSREFRHDRRAYTEAKTDFILDIYRKAGVE